MLANWRFDLRPLTVREGRPDIESSHRFANLWGQHTKHLVGHIVDLHQGSHDLGIATETNPPYGI
jgi:hypothetical protein